MNFYVFQSSEIKFIQDTLNEYTSKYKVLNVTMTPVQDGALNVTIAYLGIGTPKKEEGILEVIIRKLEQQNRKLLKAIDYLKKLWEKNLNKEIKTTGG